VGPSVAGRGELGFMGDGGPALEASLFGPPLTHLMPFLPSGWTDPIVVSNTIGTNTDSESLSPTDTLFIDYAILNSGPAPTDVRFDNTLLVDGEEVFSFFFNPPLESVFLPFLRTLSWANCCQGPTP
jgi:hypothetical protein